MHYKNVIRRLVQSGLKPLERRLIQKAYQHTYPPIFIIGPPRSGSTLLYQLVARRYRVCYFSNFMMHFPAATLSTARLSSLWMDCSPPDGYTSVYGETPGLQGPNQGKAFWDLWLQAFPHDIDPDTVSIATKDLIKNTVLGLQEVFHAPFINKWPPNSLRLRLLAEIFPDAVFIKITRNPEKVFASILRARRAICQGESGWFSVEPQGRESILRDDPMKQIQWQADKIEGAIDRDSAIIGGDRFITISYEGLVEDPKLMLDKIAGFYHRLCGYALEPRNEIPASFSKTAKL